jgi:O-antigen/teichoic acid export membrane protein
LIILSTGSLLNGLMWIPYQAQLAYKWTRLTFLINLTSVIVLIPTIILIVPIYGALGAAWIWVILNCGYLFISGSLMFKNILITEKWEWYVKDNFIPLATATFVISILKMVIPPVSNMFYQLACLIFVFGLAFVVSGSVSKYIRVYFLRIINMFYGYCKKSLV